MANQAFASKRINSGTLGIVKLFLRKDNYFEITERTLFKNGQIQKNILSRRWDALMKDIVGNNK